MILIKSFKINSISLFIYHNKSKVSIKSTKKFKNETERSTKIKPSEFSLGFVIIDINEAKLICYINCFFNVEIYLF